MKGLEFSSCPYCKETISILMDHPSGDDLDCSHCGKPIVVGDGQRSGRKVLSRKPGFTSLSQSCPGSDSASSRENGTDLSSKPSPSSRKGAGKEFLYLAIVLPVLLIVGTSLQPVFDVIWGIIRFLIGLPFLIVAYIFMS